MRGRAGPTARKPNHDNPIRRRDPSSVGFAATFSRKGRRGALSRLVLKRRDVVNLLARRQRC